MRTISLKVPEAVNDDLERRAGERCTSKSALIRAAIDAFLAADGAPASLLERATDLAGCVAGPSDLSLDPAHLDDYGA